jgi:oligopeptide transport system permease protein
MTKYIIQRVIWIFIILVVTLTITFVLLKLAPEYPPTKNTDKDRWLTQQVNDGYYTVEYFDYNNAEHRAYVTNLQQTDPRINSTVFVVNPIGNSQVIKVFTRVPIATQYFKWVENIVTEWNWGLSTKIKINQPAFGVVAQFMPLTLALNVLTLLFYLPFGFGFGIVAALKKDKFVDNLMQILIMLFISLPGLVFILLLVIVFGYELGWLPTLFPLLERESPQVIASGFVIPVIAAGLPAIAGLTRLFRAELSEVLTSEFVLLAKTKGLSHQQAVMRHAIRNSMVPMVPTVIGSFAGLLGGSFILERVYAIPGVGTVTLQALTQGNYDYNVIMTSNAFYSVIGLATALIVDLSYGIIDPQIRMGAKK